jgi:RNA-directed DNA polymerase
MLEALVEGPKGGRWYSLIDKVAKGANLRAAWEQVRRNGGAPGVDRVTIEMFEKQLEEELRRLGQEVRSGSYVPQAVRRIYIPKPGRPGEERPLGIPTVRDRVVQTAMRNVLEPIFEVGFAEHSYGFRPKRGAKDALRRVRGLIDAGHLHVVDADLKAYFDSIPHDRLLQLVRERIVDGRVLAILEAWLEQEVMDGAASWIPDQGSPQGAVISPLLANVYLDELDHLVQRAGYEMVRYADDFVILCRDRTNAETALNLVQEWTAKVGLTLHPEKTRLVDLEDGDGFTFLGYTFRKSGHWPSKKAEAKLRDAVRPLTPRKSGTSLECTIARLNPVLKGWFNYFKHTRTWVFKDLDGWVRTRLRALLWRHSRRTRFSWGAAKVIWPTAFFHRHGLFSFDRAHREATAQLRLPLQPALR